MQICLTKYSPHLQGGRMKQGKWENVSPFGVSFWNLIIWQFICFSSFVCLLIIHRRKKGSKEIQKAPWKPIYLLPLQNKLHLIFSGTIIHWRSTIGQAVCHLSNMYKDDRHISQFLERAQVMKSSPGFEFQVLSQASWLWVNYLMSLIYKFLICRIRIVIVDSVITFVIVIVSYRILSVLKVNIFICKETL